MHLSRQLGRVRRLPRRIWSMIRLKIVDVVYVLDLNDYRGVPTSPKTGVVVEPMTSADEPRLAAAFGERKARELTQRLTTCFGVVGTIGGQVAGYSWMTSGPRRGEGEHPFFYDVAPRAGWFYFFDTYVAPSARGHGLATWLKRGLIAEAQRLGGRYCLATHEQNNAAVIHVSEKLGFKLHGTMTYTRFLGAARHDLSGMPEGMRP